MLRSEWWEGFLAKSRAAVLFVHRTEGKKVSEDLPDEEEVGKAFDLIAKAMNDAEETIRAETWGYVTSCLGSALLAERKWNPCPKLPNKEV